MLYKIPYQVTVRLAPDLTGGTAEIVVPRVFSPEEVSLSVATAIARFVVPAEIVVVVGYLIN
jgi:hypothetical protein